MGYFGPISSNYRLYTSKNKPQIINSIQFPRIYFVNETKQYLPEKQRFKATDVISYFMLFLYIKEILNFLFYIQKRSYNFFL